MDPGAFNATYDQYLDKLSTGAVLGMVDQWWQFYYVIDPVFKKRIWHSLGVIMSLFLSRLMMVFTTDGAYKQDGRNRLFFRSVHYHFL